MTIAELQIQIDMKGFPSIQELYVDKEKTKNLLKKPETRKEISIGFLTTLKKIDEVEETRSKTSLERKTKQITVRAEGKKCRAERPKSANSLARTLFETDLKKRPKSSEPIGRAVSSEIRSGSEERKRQKNMGKKLCEVKECCCWQECKRECSSLLNLDSKSPGAWNLDVFENEQKEPWSYFRYSSHPPRKCRSNPNFSKSTFQKCNKLFDSERDLHKVKRSLRLLGFELSDFGIYSSRPDTTFKWKAEQKFPTFSTRITSRSISLDSLRHEVKRAWIDDSLGESHRRLLAQAAYEEWYFKKEQELWRKREEMRIARMKTKENLRDDFQKKKEKSKEEFQKWLRRKRMKRKAVEENLQQKQENQFTRVMKSKEESEQAFIKWKKTKERELEKKKMEKKKEEERKIESEKQKSEKKIIAEKAFQQWKLKLEKTERLEEAKRQRKKKQQEVEELRRREEGSQISFQMWKAAKDEQIKEKVKQIREAYRITKEERLAQMEERMYEAEQAFEDWLEKVDLRKQKQYRGMNTYQKIIPWIPA